MSELPDYPLLHHAEKVRRAMLRRDAVLLNKITKDYLLAYKSLDKQVKTLIEALQNVPATPGRVYRIAALDNLVDGVRREMQGYAGLLGKNIDDAMKIEIEKAGADALNAIKLQLPEEAGAAGLPMLQPAQVTKMFSFLDKTGPLYASLQHQFAPALAEAIRDTIMSGFIQGMNPKTIAKLISNSFGVGLNWALNTARTSVLYAYRAASQQNYLAHSDVVASWTWFAQLGPTCCLGCTSKHGSVHPVTETLDDHHRGKCLVPGTVVSGPTVEAFVSRRYDGEVISIRTASGKLLTVTPNHPILTDRGWVVAQLIEKGDNVISSAGGDRASVGMNPDKYQAPTLIEDIAIA